MLFLFVFSLSLIACDKEVEEEKEITLTLIGEDTVQIEEGTEYHDQGALVNGEDIGLSYHSNVNSNQIGTYYIKYAYRDQEIMRTVEVVAGARTELLGLIEDLDLADNFSYTLDLDVRFSRGGVDFHTFIREDYDIYGNYSFGVENRSTYQMNEITVNEYVYIDESKLIEEHYIFDEYSMWYHEYHHYPKFTTNITDFNLEGIRTTTKEEVDGLTVYKTYLNAGDYVSAYQSKMNLIPDEQFENEVDDYITLTITVKDDTIIKIETDLLNTMQDALIEASLATITEYHYVYTFGQYNEIEAIIIPQEGIDAKIQSQNN